MNNFKKSRSKKDCGVGGIGRNGRGRRCNKGSTQHQRRNFEDNGNFKKFVDNDYVNKSDYWHQSDNNKNSFRCDNPFSGVSVYPWTRKLPIKPLQFSNEKRERQASKNGNEGTENILQNSLLVQKIDEPHLVENSISTSDLLLQTGSNPVSVRSESSVSDRNNSVSTEKPILETNEKFETLKTNIKQEKDVTINLKQERKSSSSSPESSSSEDKPKLSKKITAQEIVKINATKKSNSVSESSASSSPPSTEEDESPVPLPPPVQKLTSKPLKQTKLKVSEKNNSEDEVVCIGTLENKIVLEDEVENDTIEDNTKSQLSSKKDIEKCMLCDKKGHTSFQCQMICKNCCAPYHGFRTCPHPANLNTTLQMFMEFCMQQMQNFSAGKYIGTNSIDTAEKSLTDSPRSTTTVYSKTNKRKRRPTKANEASAKTKSKKRKLSNKKHTKIESDENSNDDHDGDDDSDSETTSNESEEESSESPESNYLCRKKLKVKNNNALKAALNLSKYTPNPVNLPLVLNGFPNITVGTPTLQDSSTSSNALNTLLLTQMFQNAIGTFKK